MHIRRCIYVNIVRQLQALTNLKCLVDYVKAPMTMLQVKVVKRTPLASCTQWKVPNTTVDMTAQDLIALFPSILLTNFLSNLHIYSK